MATGFSLDALAAEVFAGEPAAKLVPVAPPPRRPAKRKQEGGPPVVNPFVRWLREKHEPFNLELSRRTIAAVAKQHGETFEQRVAALQARQGEMRPPRIDKVALLGPPQS